MADSNDDFLEDDDFEKLLDSFINDKYEEEPTPAASKDEITEKLGKAKDKLANPEADEAGENAENETAGEEDDDDEAEDEEELSEEDAQISEEMDNEDLNEELVSSLQDAKEEAKETEKQPELGSDESELAQAFVNYFTSVNRLTVKNLKKEFECDFAIDDLYPNYKPSVGRMLSDDLVKGWLLLVKMFPAELGNFPLTSTDEAFLNYAEQLKDNDLQLAIISYVEILIDLESCELSYQAKFLKYQEKHIKRVMYEEYLARKERQRKFTEALAKKNFPVDAEKLISNYFRVAQKDVDGAFKALTNNPAIFAPIDFSKIKPRWFGLVKVSPKDGIRINLEMGDFLKHLKV